MLSRLMLFAAAFCELSLQALADAPRQLCKSAAADLNRDGLLAAATTAAFGRTGFTGAATCIYPVKLLHYDDADVLVSSNQTPGEGCHGCAGELTANVLVRKGDGFRLVRTFRDFGEGGSNGSPGDPTAIKIGGDDGIAIETGGAFQGYASTSLDLYAFRKPGLVALTSAKPVPLSGDNSGAEDDAKKTIAIDGKWRIEGDRLAVTYEVAAGGEKRTDRAVWAISPAGLTLVSGAVPKEMARATGQE